MKTLKMAERMVSSSGAAGDSFSGLAAQHSSTILVTPRDASEQTASSRETFPSRAQAKVPSLRVAIKVKGKILFINLSEVISIQAKGKCVQLQQNASSYLLNESISLMAEKLEIHGFIRIHRSVLVNTSFVREIRALSTGEYCLQVEGGKEYTVTRTYKTNLRSLADFWIGASTFFPG